MAIKKVKSSKRADYIRKWYKKNKDRINKKRRTAYKKKATVGTCIRCKRKAVKGLKVCSYHRNMYKVYNARRKKTAKKVTVKKTVKRKAVKRIVKKKKR